MIAIEVDDLLMIGEEEHRKCLEKLQQIQQRHNFGKWVNLKQTPEGAMFNGRRLRQKEDGEFC